MRNQTLKRLISLTLSAAMVVSLATSQGNTSSGLTVNTNTPMTGDTLVVVNTDSSGFFTGGDSVTVNLGLPTVSASTQNGGISQSLQPGEPAPDNIMGYDENGNGIIDPNSFLEPVVFEPIESDYSIKSAEPLNVMYEVGEKKTLAVSAKSNSQAKVSIEFEMIHYSNYATVWTPVSGYSPIGVAAAKQLADEFDKQYLKMVNVFGDPMTAIPYGDRDKDGKIAIFCYDVTPLDTSDGYVAGYFDGNDMNSIKYGGYEMDLIHIDSKQGMATGVEQSYGTLMHEFQHLINMVTMGTTKYLYEYELSDGTPTIAAINGTPTFINEVFSEAADYLIYNDPHRVDDYNKINSEINQTQYIYPPASVTYWQGRLSNYGLAFMFGRYLVAQNDGDTGVFLDINSAIRNTQSEGTDPTQDEILTEIAKTVGFQTSAELITNFYTAIAMQDDSGVYSIGDPSSHENIWFSELVLPSTTNNRSLIPGAAVYYGAHTDYTPPTNNSLSYFSLTPAPPDYAENSAADVAGSDGMINTEDLTAVATSDKYNQSVGAGDPLDVNKDGTINFADLAIIRNSKNFGKAVNPNTN